MKKQNHIPDHGITFFQAFKVWLRVALLSFGGPAGQISVMHRILVDQKRWIDEGRFLHALNYCMLLPGPEAMQLATYIGWILHGVRGGLAAGVLFVLPGFISILILSFIYAGYQDLSLVQAIFFGVKAAVLALVINALLRLGKRVLKTPSMVLIAGSAFVAMFVFNVAFPLIILGAAIIGLYIGRASPDYLVIQQHASPHIDNKWERHEDVSLSKNQLTDTSWRHVFRTLSIWLSLWALPIIGLIFIAGYDHVFTQLAIFFSKLAVVTFGGAYAVLAYLAQEAVQTYGWLSPEEMLDGLGMAETTPGPLIQVVQFVGYMAGYRDISPLHPLLSGVIASFIVTWVTFVPCFLWIFLGAPFIEKLRGNHRLNIALSTVTAAVVGVILNLAIWFAMHVLFDRLYNFHNWGMSLQIPDFTTINFPATVIAIGSIVAILRYNVGMITVLFSSAIVGTAYHLTLSFMSLLN